MHNLAYVCNLAGQYDRAAKLSLELLDLAREIAYVQGESIALGLLGDAYHGLGRYSEAVEALGAALSLFRGHCNRRRHVGLCLLKLGHAYEKLGQPQQARRYLKESLAIFRELRFPHYEERALNALANCRPVSSS